MWLAFGALLAVALVAIAPRLDSAGLVWLLPLGLLAAVVGMVGMIRLAVSQAGRAFLHSRSGQIAGARMRRSPSDSTLGTTAAAVAILLVAFVLSANFSPGPPDVGAFNVVAELPNIPSSGNLAKQIGALSGVEHVHHVGRSVVLVNGEEMSLYTASCADLVATARISTQCTDRQLYLGKRVKRSEVGIITQEQPASSVGIDGSYPVGGTAEALWMRTDEAVLATSEGVSQHTQLMIQTDGSADSLRAVYAALRDRAEVASLTTREALAAGPDADELVAEPYLAVMVSAAGAIAAFALALAALLLLRQRRREFEMIRCLGVTAPGLTASLAVLFFVPLVLALALACALGYGLGATYNISAGVPFREVAGLLPVVASVAASAMMASFWVISRTRQISAVVPDPDAVG